MGKSTGKLALQVRTVDRHAGLLLPCRPDKGAIREVRFMVAAGIGKLCAHHPDRAGFALCMSCKQVVCQECATTWDGINYCRPCLTTLRGVTTGAGRWRKIASGLVMLSIGALLFVACARLMVWSVVLLGGWR